jgi:hypothetical protein
MMDWNEVTIQMEIKDSYKRTQYSECYESKAVRRLDNPFYKVNYVKTNNIGINKSSSESNQIELKIHQNSKLASIMQNLFTIELSVVPKKVCVGNK